MENTDVDSLRQELVRQKQRLEYDYRTIRGLAGAYDELHLYNLETGEYSPYFVETENSLLAEQLMAKRPDFCDALRLFIDNFCHPDDIPKLICFTDKDGLREALRSKKRHVERIRLKKYDGEYFWSDFVLLKFDDADRAPSLIAAGLISVDDIVKAETERLKAIEDARHAEAAQKERYNFLINVAHELRTPLTLILGPVGKILRKEEISEGARASLVRVRQQGERMALLLNTVLTTNKIDEGAATMKFEQIDINGWVRASVEEFADEAQSHNIELTLDLDPSLGTVRMDEHLGKIVFSNLMMNAIRYTRGNSSILVTTSPGEMSQSSVRVSVCDSGFGIGDIDPDKLFERYYRATEEKTGFGIGLSYSKKIIDAHCGRIGAYNNAGPGATFWFELDR